jgi:hypothetical protein
VAQFALCAPKVRLGKPPSQQSVRVITENFKVLCETKLKLCAASKIGRSTGVRALALLLDDVHDSPH